MTAVAERPLADLIDHVLGEYHRKLPSEVTELAALADAVLAEGEGQGFALALGACRELGEELLLHARKEEKVLFPWLRAGRGATAGGPVQVMTVEHHDALRVMAEVRSAALVARDAPAACLRAWATAYLAFDRRLREHMRLEDQEIFPRALAGR
jgi:regulator of cell morphogenesis and NO signaling